MILTYDEVSFQPSSPRSFPMEQRPSHRPSSGKERDPQRDALDLLITRQSRWPLGAPAPSQAELDRVFDVALRAPDHGQLQPWRFVVIRGEAREALGEVFVQAAKERDPDGEVERFRAKATAAPLLIAMGAHLRANHKVPEIEQLMAVGAAAMNMLNALHILGYGAFWSTGLNARDETVKRALGFDDSDRLIGFLYVGTPKERAQAAARPPRRRFVREWQPLSLTRDVLHSS
jgi:nitroreductase